MRKILYGGKIYVEKGNFQEALILDNNIILTVGSNEEILKNRADQLINLAGKTVLPGLNDSHLHLVEVGASMNSCDLASSRSIDDLLEMGRNFLSENMEVGSILGRGWNQDYFTDGEKRMPTRYDLDKISRDIPLVFIRVCGHLATANSKALELLAVDETTRIEGGVIEIGEDGSPNGIFTENAVAFLLTVIPPKSEEEIKGDFIKACNYATSLGITSVQSCDVIGKNSSYMFDIIRDAYGEGRPSLRYSHQFNFQDIEDFKGYLEGEFISGCYDEQFLSKGALKLFLDGSLGARTALMLEDYRDDPGNRGVQVLSGDELDKICRLASDRKIQIISHVIGDGALDLVLDAYEKVLVNGRNPLRHGIVHCQISSRSQLERIARLGILVMYQPIFLDYDISIVKDRVGEELASTSYAFNSLYRLGAPISLSSDAPVEDCNPWNNIYCAVNRTRLDGSPSEGFYPEEKMDLYDAIDSYTYGGAFNESKENFKGRLNPGYLADLIVLNKDIFTIDTEEVKNIIVEKTMIDGDFI